MAAAAKIAQKFSAQSTAAIAGGSDAKQVFLETCRILPWAVKNYQLDELITVPVLRKKIAAKFRQTSDVSDPSARALLYFKARQELELIVTQNKQRHHLLTEWVFEEKAPLPKKDAPKISEFLKNFYASNGVPHTLF
ncbi:hypothetical protein BSKO_02088 [Bryopsis sp. KO-2023]|nr:hypothetical protein BSKO_02088 [Bryopsis sp. KO-2023]